VAALIAISAASGAALLILGAQLTFLSDDWAVLTYRPGWSASSILTPHNEHIYVFPILIYKGLQETFGMASAFPYRVASTAAFLASAALVFEYVRRRTGDWLALIGAAMLLFLGSAYEDLLWSFQIGFFGSIAAGIGALLALEREEDRSDRIACGLLVASIAFLDMGLMFVIGAAVKILLGKGDRRRRVYVVVLPLALYVLWWLAWGPTSTDASVANAAKAPLVVIEAVGAAIAALFGLPLSWRIPLALAAVLLATLRINALGRVPRQIWPVLVIAASFWLAAAIDGRGPTASRYLYPGSALLLLITSELLNGMRPRQGALLVAAAIAVAAIVSNSFSLHDGFLGYRDGSRAERADLAALELARGTVAPGFGLSRSSGTPFDKIVGAGAYFTAADRYGSPAYTPKELAASPAFARGSADSVLASAERIRLRGDDVRTPPGLACRDLVPAAGTPGTTTTLEPGSFSLSTIGPSSAILGLGRFRRDRPSAQLGRLGAGRTRRLRIPTDPSPLRWGLYVIGAVRLCRVA